MSPSSTRSRFARRSAALAVVRARRWITCRLLIDVLDKYDFRRLGPGQEAKRGALLAYIKQMTDSGRENELAIPQSVLDRANQVPYKTVPMEELRGVIDSVKNMEHVAPAGMI